MSLLKDNDRCAICDKIVCMCSDATYVVRTPDGLMHWTCQLCAAIATHKTSEHGVYRCNTHEVKQ